MKKKSLYTVVYILISFSLIIGFVELANEIGFEHIDISTLLLALAAPIALFIWFKNNSNNNEDC